MSILTVGPSEIARRKTVSDFKNNTDNLTFSESKTNSSHGAAYKTNRERKEDADIKALENQTVDSYYNDLELDELASTEKVWSDKGLLSTV